MRWYQQATASGPWCEPITMDDSQNDPNEYLTVHWAELITPTMALFANTIAADFKKGDIIMFAMGSSCPDRVAPERTDV
jgi:hypothetical protein